MNRYTAFVVTDDELVALDSFAESDGITIKEVVSRLILDEVQRRLGVIKRIAPPDPLQGCIPQGDATTAPREPGGIFCDVETELELQAIRDTFDP